MNREICIHGNPLYKVDREELKHCFCVKCEKEKIMMKIKEIDKNSDFYKNCKRRRNEKAKICQSCPFKDYIETWEILNNYNGYDISP